MKYKKNKNKKRKKGATKDRLNCTLIFFCKKTTSKLKDQSQKSKTQNSKTEIRQSSKVITM
jgi:hypothetical protein